MKITKIDGISHKKYKEKGKLIKNNDTAKDIIEERFNDIEKKTKELFQKTLDFYVKNYEKCKEQNKERREKAKNYFSKVKILVDNKKITICNENTEKMKIEDFNEYDVRSGKYFNVLNKILNGENYTEEDLEVFENDLQKRIGRIKSIKNSLEENKAHFKKESINNNIIYDRVKGNNKKSLFYEYYRISSKHQEYVNNIFEAFDKLYSNSHEAMNNLFSEITKDSKDRNIRKIREAYHEILNKNKTEFGEELYKKIQDNINNFDKLLEIEPEIKELTKSQIFYKYYIDKVSLDGTNIKNCFSHLVEIEVNKLLKNYVYSKRSTNKEKLENIFEYCKLRNLVKNKLVNKLNSYIRNCGKYNSYISNNDVVNSEKISEIRTKEAFLRSIIGVSSSAYFSLRNILNTDNTQDITNKVDKEVDKLYQENKKIELEERLKLFFGNYFDINNQQEIKAFLMNIDKIISSIRHEIIHFKMEANAQNIFDFNNINLGNVAKNIFSNEINEEKIKFKIFKQLNSANVFDYLSNKDITEYMGKAVFSFTNRNIPFVPSFTKIYNKVQDLANSLEIKKWKIPDKSEGKDAQIYLLKNIYYGKFLDEFLNEENGIFISIKDKIIELNRNQNKRTGFCKLEKFEKIEEKNPKKYLEIVQSLYMINIEEIDSEKKNVFLDFIQKIFLKGFFEFIKNDYNYLLELKKVQDKKNIFDSKMSEYIAGEKTLEDIGEINEIIQKIEITKIDKILNQTETDKINCFYLLLKLLNYKEITELKGNLEKYQILSKTNIYEKELMLLNIVNLDNNKVKIENFKISAEEIGKFIEKINIEEINIEEINKKIKTFEELRNFEKGENTGEYYNIYSDDKNIKNIRNLYNIKKYGMLDLLEKISEKTNYCIKKKDLEEYSKLRKQLKDKKKENEKIEDEKTNFYKIQEYLHSKYQQEPKKILWKNNKNDYEKYKKSIENIEKYVHLKNKIEFNELNLLQSLLLKILHRLAGFTSIWERDLRFRLTGEFPDELDVEDIFDHRKRYKGTGKGICKKYDRFINTHTEYKNNNKMKNVKFADNNPVRNYIAHFNYLPTPKYSILKMMEKLRKLLDYDRKLKNAVMKSIKDILEEYGFKAEFIINSDKEIILNSVKSVEIIHLGREDLKSHRNSEDLCKLVKALLEYSE